MTRIRASGQARTFRTRGRVTSVALEEPFWRIVERIADERGLAVSALLGHLHSATAQTGTINLSSSLRIACLQYLAEQAGMAIEFERQAS